MTAREAILSALGSCSSPMTTMELARSTRRERNTVWAVLQKLQTEILVRCTGGGKNARLGSNDRLWSLAQTERSAA